MVSTPLPYDVGTSVAGAIIEHPSLGFLLQLRDEYAPSYPLHWGLFGGHMEADEAPEAAIWRELREELQLGREQVSDWQLVQRNPRSHGGELFIFHILTNATTDDLVLGEGKAMRYVAQPQLVAATRVPERPLFGHSVAAVIAHVFQDHFAGRRDSFDLPNGSLRGGS